MAGESELTVDPPRCMPFPTLQDSLQWLFGAQQRSYDSMHMVRLHDIAVEFVALAVEVVQGVSDQLSRAALFQTTTAHPLVQPLFDAAHGLTRELLELD